MARLSAMEKKGSTASSDGGGDGIGSDAAADGTMSSNVSSLVESKRNQDATTTINNDNKNKMVIDKPSSDAKPMEVDDDDRKPAASPSKPPAPPSKDAPTMEPATKKQATKSPATKTAETSIVQTSPSKTNAVDPLVDAARKLRRKKMLILRRVLLVTIGSDPADRNPSCVHLTLDDDDCDDSNDTNDNKPSSGFEIRQVAEILAARLSLSPSCQSLETMPPQKPGIIAYLGGCHKRAGEEWKEVRQAMEKKNNTEGEELCGILEEIRKQVGELFCSRLWQLFFDILFFHAH